MRFNCGPTREQKENEISKWHGWFAWFPVRVESRDCRWLEHVERKANCWTGRYSGRRYADWTYRKAS